MKNVKRIAAVLIAALVILTCFAACSSPEKDIVGVWKDSTGAGYEFREGGTCTLTGLDVLFVELNVDGAYSVEKRDDGNHYITITYTALGASKQLLYMFTVEKDVLTLTRINDDGTFANPVVYTAYQAEATTAPTAAAQ